MICDDEKNQLKILYNLIKKYCEKNNIEFTCEKFNSGEKAIEAFKQIKFDIIFLDIKMEGISGLQTAEKIRQLDKDVLIIFITKYPNYTFEAFNNFAFNYIVKPIKEKIFFKIMDVAIRKVQEHQYFIDNTLYIIIKDHGKLIKIYYRDIIYFEKKLNKIFVHTINQGTLKTIMTLNSLESKLKSNIFIRCHKGFIINKYKIKTYRYGEIELENCQEKITVGRTYQNKIKEILYKNINIF